MAAISREEEQAIREWQKRTGGGCIDYRPTQEQQIAATERELRYLHLQLLNYAIRNS